MSSSQINNVTAPDAYSDTATWQGASAEAFVVTVANAAIYAEIGHGDAGVLFGESPEDGPHFLIPGVHSLPGGNAVRFRNAVAGAAAQVSIRPAPGKALESGYASLSGLKVDATGNVSYDFDGHVHATGLDLTAGTSSAPPSDRHVRWLDVLGNVVADLFGYSTTLKRAGADMRAKSAQGSGLADLILSAQSDATSALQGSVSDDTNGNQAVDIIRSDGKSSFFRVRGAPRYAEVNFGFDFLQFAGSYASNFKAINHGLHTTPSLVLAMARAPANVLCTIEEAAAPDASEIYFYGYQTQAVAVTQSQSFYWLAAT